MIFRLPLYAAAALVVPEPGWCALSRGLERATSWLKGARLSAIRRGLALSGLTSGGDALAVQAVAAEQSIAVLRELLGGWSPQLHLTGREHLDAARRAGRGAVLWVAHFGFASLAAKMALARAGYEVHHVSRPEHGFSKSRFGIRVLNPLRVATELRYLKGRVIIDRNNPAASMVEARQILKQNAFVSITAGSWEGQLIATAPLGAGQCDLATGAPRLANLADAPLIPVFVVKDESGGGFTVTVEPPIALSGGRDKNALVAAATDEFMRRHVPYLTSHPYQWREWEKFRPVG